MLGSPLTTSSRRQSDRAVDVPRNGRHNWLESAHHITIFPSPISNRLPLPNRYVTFKVRQLRAQAPGAITMSRLHIYALREFSAEKVAVDSLSRLCLALEGQLSRKLSPTPKMPGPESPARRAYGRER